MTMSRSTQTICAMSSNGAGIVCAWAGAASTPIITPTIATYRMEPRTRHRIAGRPTVAMLWQVGRLPCMEVKQLVGWNSRRVRQERGLIIEALAHQAHVSAAWLGEEFKNGQAPAVSAAGLIQRRSPHPPLAGGTK